MDYQQCTRCILDTNDDKEITFDQSGVCRYCQKFDQWKSELVVEGEEGLELLESTIREIKAYGKGKPYDCLIGLSGGVDSSYVAYLAGENGLRALCIHFDNGWNSEIAVMNIHNIVNKFNFDLNTYVIDWEEFKDLQLAYLKASVVDIEVLTDHAIYGSMFKIAKENNIKYVLGGHNVATEGVLPYAWTYDKKDHINIKAIHRQFGTRAIKTFPFFDRKMKKFMWNSGIEFINYLNWISYDKSVVKKTLIEKLDWKDYGAKHFESVWTRFYQGYILPTKFKIDKRKAHLSSLICDGQMSRDQALEEIKLPIYDPELLRRDMDFVLKKLKLSREEFSAIMSAPVRSHREFDTHKSIFSRYPVLKALRPTWRYLKSKKLVYKS